MPGLSRSALANAFFVWTFSESQPYNIETANPSACPIAALPLLANDPLIREEFCLVLARGFSLVVVLAENKGEREFQFSFDPEAIALAWNALRSRVMLTGTQEQLKELDSYYEQFAPVVPHYKTVMHFSQLLVKYLPENLDSELDREQVYRHKRPCKLLGAARGELATEEANSVAAGTQTKIQTKTKNRTQARGQNKNKTGGQKAARVRAIEIGDGDRAKSARVEAIVNVVTEPNVIEPTNTEANSAKQGSGKSVFNETETSALDVELLQAIAHEVRTPLTTIRTLTRLLLKRTTDSVIRKRLETIDRECTEQIDRFSLFFRAVELETSKEKQSAIQLTAISLTDVFNQCIPRWQKQASRRNLTLEVSLPHNMPRVVSDPTMLDRVLTGAIENFTSSLPTGCLVQVQVTLAGDRLKMVCSTEKTECNRQTMSPLKSIGQLLAFQPETGSVTLNLSATKHMFQALGAKMTVRQRSPQGQVLTIFLPLEA
ncbi:MAG: HAMP domain-containing histidine kinase [Oscillatoria sp. SIO1A7]|nr:HAMP domain-containing histidine kinase [Oscillatoria sp. SIO1A7]